ncbi:hypothetical protein TNCT_464021 [Trichonephila clavata]|uniref:C2H2-type domain-containing protein n=1 Tax=Trichonephila clavata TaxID=2740835 RepID=A0A8X6J0U4_TRICU|nr:hypothetical protein TNCT_464021 [Trichonephila clavata]
MAEGNAGPPEEESFLVCLSCARVRREPGLIFTSVSSQEPPFTCVKCKNVFRRGLQPKRLSSCIFLPQCFVCGESFQRLSELFSHPCRDPSTDLWDFRRTLS